MNLKNITDIYLEINTNCNINCPYCYNKNKLQLKEEISMDDVISVMKFLKKTSCKRIIISGGEPLLAKNFMKIIDLLSEEKYELQLISNCYFLDGKTYNFLKEKKVLIGCSLDTYNQSDKNVKRLLEKNFVNDFFFENIYAIMCVYGQDISQIKKLLFFLYRNKIKYLNISFIVDMLKDKHYIECVLDLIIDYNNRGMQISSEILTSVLENILIKPIKHCSANKIIKINTNLSIFPCYLCDDNMAYGKIVNGNAIINEPLFEKFDSKIYNSKHSLCNNCEYKTSCAGCCYFTQNNSEICLMQICYNKLNIKE